MSDELVTQLKVTADVSQASQGFTKIGADAETASTRVSKAAKTAQKSLADLGVGSSENVKKLGEASKQAAAGIGAAGTAAKSAVSDTNSLNRAVEGLNKQELAFINAQVRKANAMRMNTGDMSAYVAQSRGMSQATQDIARAIGQKVDLMKQEQSAAGSSVSLTNQAAKAYASLAATILVVTQGLGKLVSVQREFDKLNSSLVTVTGSAQNAASQMAWIKDFAKETPFGLTQATEAFVKMKALGLDPTRQSLTSFGNTASAMGKDLNQMIEAVADASTGEFERLKEFGVKASKNGEEVKLTFQGITTTVRNSAEEITKYLEGLGNNQFAGAMAERAKTLDGAIAELGDTWDEFFRSVNENNTGQLIYDSVKLATGAIDDLTTIVRAANGAMDDGARAGQGFKSVQEGIATVFETVTALGLNVKYVLTQVGNEIGGLVAQGAALARGDFAGAGAIRDAMVSDAKAARAAVDQQTQNVLQARKNAEDIAAYRKQIANSALGNVASQVDGFKPEGKDEQSLQNRVESMLKATSGLKSQAEAMGEVKKQGKELSGVLQQLRDAGKGDSAQAKELEARLQGVNEKLESMAKKGRDRAGESAIKKEQSEYDKLISSIKLKIAENEEEIKYGRKLSEADKLRFAISEDGAKKLTAAHKAEAEAALKKLDATTKQIEETKRVVAAYKEQVAAQDEANKAYVDQYNAMNRVRQAVNELRDSAQQDAMRLQKEASLIGASNLQRKISMSLYDLEIEKKRELEKVNSAYFDSEEKRQEQRVEVEKAYAQKAANAAGQAYLEEWSATVQQVEDLFVTSFADMLGNGKDGWESFCKSLKNSFMTMVAKQIYAAFVKPIVVNLVGNLMGMTGGGGWLSALGGLIGMGGGGGSGGTSALGMASNASTLYGLGSGSTLGTAGNFVTSAGTYFGSNSLTGLGMSMQGYTLPASMVGPGAGVGVGAGAGAGTAAAGTPGAAATAGLGVAAGAVAFIAAVAYLAGMFKDEKQVGAGITGTLGGDLYGYQLMRESGGLFDGPDYRYLIAEKEIADTKAKIEALKKDPAYEGKGEAARENKLQALYNKLDTLERNYNDAIAGSQGPIKILQDAFKAMREGTASQADSLGLDGDSIRKMKVELGLDTIHPDTGGKGLELTGLSQAEATAKIQAALDQANEELARSVLGSWQEQTKEVTRTIWEDVAVDDGGDTERFMRVGKQITETITENVFVMSEYVREGETAVQALGRLSTSLLTANHVFDLLGGTLFDTSLAGADMASDLMDLFGGAEKFVASTSNYYDKFYSDQDKVDTQTRLLNAELKKLGIETMPASREELTKYIDGLDLTTEGGQKLFASLMGLVDVFDMIYTSAENIAALKGDLGMQLLRAQGNDKEATRLEREKQIKELEKYKDPELVKLQKEVWAAEDKNKADADAKQALETAKSAGLANLQAAIGREKEYWASFTTDAKDALTKASSYFDLVTGAAKSLRGSIDDTSSWSAAAGMVYIEQALANARMGLGLSDFDKTRDSIGAATGGLVMDNYATQAELNYDKKMLAGQLDELGGFAELAKSDAQKQLDIGNAQIKRLDDTLKFWQDYGKDQVDATMSVTDAVNALFKLLDPKEQERIKAEEAAKAGVGGGGGATGASPVFSGGGVLGGSVAGSNRVTVIGLTADGRAMFSDGSVGQYAAGQHAYNSTGSMVSNGYSAAEFERFKASGEYELDPATGNWRKRASFAIGTNYVPRNMTANIHEGERIIPAADNRALMAALNNQGGGNAEVVAAVNRLESRMASVESNTAATAEYARRTSSDLNQVTENGNAMRVLPMNA